MQRIMPRNTQVKISFWRGLTVPDLIVGFISLLLFALSIATNVVFGFFVLCACGSLFFTLNGERIYNHARYFAVFFANNSLFTADGKCGRTLKDLQPINKINTQFIKTKDNTFHAALELLPVEFRLIDESKQDMLIETLARAVRAISSEQKIEILKTINQFDTLPMQAKELSRMETLLDENEKGLISDNECVARYDLIDDRLQLMKRVQNDFAYDYNSFYVLISGSNEKGVDASASEFQRIMDSAKIETLRLSDARLHEFVQSLNFPKRQVKFCLRNTLADSEQLTNFVVFSYPLQVSNAWAFDLFNIPNTRVAMSLKPVEQSKAIKRIDNAIMELAGRKKTKASKAIDNETHLETLAELLESLQNDNETLFDTTLTITAIDAVGKTSVRDEVRKTLRAGGYGFNEMFARQQDVFCPMFQSNERIKISRGMPSECVAAAFPFISNAQIDSDGILIGENDLPVFLDIWKRDNEHVNSNIIVIGKTGSGKTYFAKTLLAALATDNTRVFILDPENEYATLAKALGGESIDVSSSVHGIINPLEIMRVMEGDFKSAFSYHLQFLEEFFKLALPGIDSDSFETMNNLVAELYAQFGISENTDFQTFGSENFPIFDDLCRLIETRLKDEQEPTKITKLQTVSSYLTKFGSGGRFSDIWNGHTTLRIDAGFVNFDFQKLISNKNKVVANAQMLLIFKWLENEIMLNRDKQVGEKIAVAVDEAHLFVDDKHPVALDFMCQMAKRIRKYGGLQIVITQSLKDFTGSPETVKKAMAVINASQYSFIFSLPPSDLNDLTELYEKSGKINESEQYCITHNSRGAVFAVLSPERRTNVQIVASPKLDAIIKTRRVQQ